MTVQRTRECPGRGAAEGHVLVKGFEIGGGDDSTHQRSGERHALDQAKHTVSAKHTDTVSLRLAFGACVDALDQALGQRSRARCTEARLESLADLLVFVADGSGSPTDAAPSSIACGTDANDCLVSTHLPLQWNAVFQNSRNSFVAQGLPFQLLTFVRDAQRKKEINTTVRGLRGWAVQKKPCTFSIFAVTSW